MEDLILLGIGVHPAELVEIIDRVNAARPRWRLVGFLAAPEQKAESDFCGLPVLGTWREVDRFPDARFLPVAVPGQGTLALSLGLPRERFATIIDPSAFVSRTARLGYGCTFYPHCFVGRNARIEDFVFSLSGTIINHDDLVESGVCMASGVNLAGHVHVGRDSYLGAGTLVRQNIRIGAEAFTGMGAVVVKDVPPKTVVAGNPARILRKLP